MKLYKLTDSRGRTRPGKTNECQWSENVTHTGTGEGDLCGPGFVHSYTDPLLAVLLNPIYANYADPQLWECEGEIAKTDFGLKVGCVSLTTIRRLTLPQVTTEHRVRFAILCALRVYAGPTFVAWANNWLSGTDRTAIAAEAAAVAAEAVVAWAAAEAAAVAAAAWAPAMAAIAAEAAAAKLAAVSLDLVTLAREAMQ